MCKTGEVKAEWMEETTLTYRNLLYSIGTVNGHCEEHSDEAIFNRTRDQLRNLITKFWNSNTILRNEIATPFGLTP